MKEIATITYLMTKEDYISFNLAERTGKTDKNDKLLIYAISAFLLIMGLIFQISDIKDITINEKRFITIMFVFAGVFSALYNDFIVTLAGRISAERFCSKNSEKLVSNTIVIYEGTIKINNDRYAANIPIDAINSGYENKDVIVLYHSVNDHIFIPKRGMDNADEVSAYLKNKIKIYKIKK